MKDFNAFNIKQETTSNVELSVLLVGNNPMEVSVVYEKLFDLQDKIKRIDMAFSPADMLKKNHLSKPNCILLNGSMGINPLKKIVSIVNELSDKMISITLLKTHNRQELTSGVHEYVVRDGIDSNRIYKALKHALKFQKEQQMFKIKSFSGKKNMKRMFI